MPSEDLVEVAKDLGLPRNTTLDSNWYLRGMKQDPLRWYLMVSYGVLITVTLHSLFYTHKADLKAFKEEVVRSIQSKVVMPTTTSMDVSSSSSLEMPTCEINTDGKFWEKKSTIVTAGQILVLICMGLTMLIPMSIVRKITMAHFDAINHGAGRNWVYISRVAVPMSHQFLFPLFILINNSRMRSGLVRNIKELQLFNTLEEVKIRILSFVRCNNG